VGFAVLGFASHTDEPQGTASHKSSFSQGEDKARSPLQLSLKECRFWEKQASESIKTGGRTMKRGVKTLCESIY